MDNLISMLAVAPNDSQSPILLIIGFAIFAGTFGAKIFQRLRIPQVVGYIAIGVVIGKTGFRIIDDEQIHSLLPFTYFALGVIGFLIGGELHLKALRKHGRQYLTILLLQGVGAFVLAGVGVGVVALLATGNAPMSIALGLLFGAIASATAPAATVSVLREYKTRGPVTRAVYAVIAMDDGLALVLFAVAFSIAAPLIAGVSDGDGTLAMVGTVAYELVGSVALGVAGGAVLNFVLRRVRAPEMALTIAIGALALVLGGALALHLGLILSAMTLGMTLVNLAPRRSEEAFRIVERFSAPIYVLFFVLVGAELSLEGMQPWLWLLAAPFVLLRMAAKIGGANLGARWVGAAGTVRKYLGWCLFCQGGVAIALAMVAGAALSQEKFGDDGKTAGKAIIALVIATTLFIEIVGPVAVKLAVHRAGEVGLDVTEEDLIRSYAASDVVDRTCPVFNEGDTVGQIMRTVSATDAMHYPVVDRGGDLKGMISIQGLKASFAGAGMTEWLVAADVMEPVPATVPEGAALDEAMTSMREQHLEFMPVVAGEDNPHLTGVLELRAVNRSISQEMLRRRQLADEELG